MNYNKLNKSLHTIGLWLLSFTIGKTLETWDNGSNSSRAFSIFKQPNDSKVLN